MKFVLEGKETEKPIALGLTITYDGNVLLRVMKTNCGNLLTLNTDGTLARVEGVDPKLGFQLDAKGCIKLSE